VFQEGRLHAAGAAVSVERTGSGWRHSPQVLGVSSVAPEKNAQLSSLIAEIRSQADAFVSLSGGASRMRDDHQRQLLAMFEALAAARQMRSCRCCGRRPSRGAKLSASISPRAIHHLKLFSDWLCLNAAQPLALRIVHVDESQ
jgi:hypothetical protein